MLQSNKTNLKKVPWDDQRLVTNSDFLNHLTLPGRNGHNLVQARKRGDELDAIRLVAQHFRTRKGPVWPFYIHGSSWLEVDGRGPVIPLANALCAGKIGIEKHHRGVWPNRCNFMVVLSTAYALTGKVRYLKKARDLLKQFVEAHPFLLDPHFEDDHDTYFGLKGNNTLDVAYRSLRLIDFLHCGAFQIKDVYSDEAVFWYIKLLWFYAAQYRRFCGDTMRRDNHHLVDHGHFPYAMGVMFPEFSFSKALLSWGKKVIKHHFKGNLFEDGGYAEHCTKYQYHIIVHHLQPWALALVNRLPLFNAHEIARLRKWVEFLIRATKPDGMLSDFGDQNGSSMEYVFDTLAAPVMNRRLSAMVRALGYEPGRLQKATPSALARRFRNKRLKSISLPGLYSYYTRKARPSPPKSRDLPEPATGHFPNGGFTFFRSGWNKDADFFGVSHNSQSLPHCHSHWDMMSFLLHTQGKTLIGDPATWIYGKRHQMAPKQKQLSRGYLYNALSHNCLIMDNDALKTIEACADNCFWGGISPRHGIGHFQSGGPIEILEVWHDGYAPTRHRRFVIHVKGMGFAFIDMLGRRELDLRYHTYEQLFHFENGVKIALNTRSGIFPTVRVHKGRARCVVTPGGELASKWQIRHDRYLAGILNGDPRDKGPFIATLTRKIVGPCVFSTFFATGPRAKTHLLGECPSAGDLRQHCGTSANLFDLGDRGRIIIGSCPYGKPIHNETLSTNAELAVIVLNDKDQVRSWSMLRGTKLVFQGKSLPAKKRVR